MSGLEYMPRVAIIQSSMGHKTARKLLRKKAIERNFGLTGNVPANLSVILGPNWKEDTFSTLEKVGGFSGDVTDFQIVDRQPTFWTDWTRSNQWVKPNFALVEQAASKRKALYVNKHGDFRLIESEYTALSHTWSEGLYADNENLGLPRHVLDQLFSKLEILGDVEWVWMDCLAVLGGDRDLSVAEEKIKIALINNMDNIYTKVSERLLTHFQGRSEENLELHKLFYFRLKL